MRSSAIVRRSRICLRGLSACALGLAAHAGMAAAASQEIMPADSLSLDDLSAFHAPPANWQIVGAVSADPFIEHDLETRPGTGVLANVPGDDVGGNLATELQHGDLVLDLEYLMPKGSNSGIYLQGRYEIQLLDSWGIRNPTYGAAAGIYERWDESLPEGEKGYEGQPPRINASRAPGLWQHLRIEFLAPKFDERDRKTRNAVVRRVVHNGVVVHENVQLTGPTRGPALPGEASRGPIVIQGDHGPIAFKNIRYELHVPPDTNRSVPDAQPVHVDVERDPVFIRSMAEHGSGKITHALNVGFPEGVHYSVDLTNGAVFRVWRGPFADATPMWYSRGIDQTIEPLGSVVELDARPPIGAMDADGLIHSDSSAFRFRGYSVGDDGAPTLMYAAGDVRVTDVLSPAPDGQSLIREMTFRSEYDASDMWVRVASSREIERTGDTRYAVGGRTYYVELDEALLAGAYVHDDGSEQTLLVPVGESGSIRYKVIW